MLEQQDDVALWLAAATLEADGQAIAALEVDDLKASVDSGKTLDSALDEMRRFDQQAGDFGAEIVGALLVPIVVEAARQLWASYLKELTAQGGKQLASLTVESIRVLVKRLWLREPDLPTRYAALLRAEAEQQRLPPEQVERLVQTIAGPALADKLAAL